MMTEGAVHEKKNILELFGTPAAMFAFSATAQAASAFGHQEPPACTSLGADDSLDGGKMPGGLKSDLDNGPIGCFSTKATTT